MNACSVQASSSFDIIHSTHDRAICWSHWVIAPVKVELMRGDLARIHCTVMPLNDSIVPRAVRRPRAFQQLLHWSNYTLTLPWSRFQNKFSWMDESFKWFLLCDLRQNILLTSFGHPENVPDYSRSDEEVSLQLFCLTCRDEANEWIDFDSMRKASWKDGISNWDKDECKQMSLMY